MNRSEEVAIRKALVDAGIIDCIVALPTKLFANTSIPVCLWFVSKNRGEHAGHRDRSDVTLFIDARKLGQLVSRRQRELTPGDVKRIADTYHAFRDLNADPAYEDVEGYCNAASRSEIEKQGFVLTPGRYVGTPETDEDEVPAAERLEHLRKELLDELDTSAAAGARLRDLLANVVSGA